jgi:hypothetical protein
MDYDHDAPLDDSRPAPETYRIKLPNMNLHLWHIEANLYMAVFVYPNGVSTVAFVPFPSTDATTHIPDGPR